MNRHKIIDSPDGHFKPILSKAMQEAIDRCEDPGPLLKQFSFDSRENSGPGTQDPLKEKDRAGAGWIQKYQGRLLLWVTSLCPVHCRYCFRRHFSYPDHSLNYEDFSLLKSRLQESPEIKEVILSGGDPLMVSNEILTSLVTFLSTFPLKAIRIHSRCATALPSRFDKGLLSLLNKVRGPKIILVSHVNHSSELSPASKNVFSKLTHVTQLNQSVLLKDVNDDPDTLIDLSWALLKQGVLPYYLHQLDPVKGASHFKVSLRRGREIIRKLKLTLPGYLVPRYVVEKPSVKHKVWL